MTDKLALLVHTRPPANVKLGQAKARANREKHERPFEIQLRAYRFPEPRREYRFAAIAVGWNCQSGAKNPKPELRQRLLEADLQDWRFDFAWPEHKLAVEIDGAPGFGRHTTAAGFKSDCRKSNAALILGWRVLRVTGDMVRWPVPMSCVPVRASTDPSR